MENSGCDGLGVSIKIFKKLRLGLGQCLEQYLKEKYTQLLIMRFSWSGGISLFFNLLRLSIFLGSLQ